MTQRWLPSLIFLALTGCAADPPESETEVESPVLTTVGIERIIPIHFFVLDNTSAPCADVVTTHDAYEGVREANRTWQSAGVQFSVSRIDRVNTPTFADLTVSYSVPWSSVWAELRAIEPSLTSSTFYGWHTRDEWLGFVASLMTPREIALIVPCKEESASSNGHASYPWLGENHLIHIPPRMLKNSTISHELGHFFGLKHTFEVDQDADYDQYFGWDGRNATFFTSAAQVAAYRDATHRVLRKDSYRSDVLGGPQDTANCAYIDMTTCEMKCYFGYGSYRTSTNPDALRGISHKVAGGSHLYATNVMSYFWCGTSAEDGELKDLEPSGIEQIRTALRSSQGQRDQLGRGSVRLGPKRSKTIDFDGDGKRDLAFYRPDTGECIVRRSTDGVEQTILNQWANKDLGDIPVPGDYDGDGKTDCAVYRPGTATTPAYWIWAGSRSGYYMHQEAFGEVGDVPVPDVTLPAASGYGKFAVFRPTTGQLWWRDSATSVRNVTWGAGAADELVLGDYDQDGLTDLAAWQPKQAGSSSAQAYLRIAYSRYGYGVTSTFPFGLETDVPLGPVSRDADPTTDFAVWRPSNGTWYYLLNPRANGSSGYLEQSWGLPGDVPVPGWDFDGDHRDDEVIWRPAGSGTQLWIHKTLTNAVYATGLGLTGDVPFFAPDANGDGMPELFLFRPSGLPEGRHFELDSYGGAYPWYAPIATSMLESDIEL